MYLLINQHSNKYDKVKFIAKMLKKFVVNLLALFSVYGVSTHSAGELVVRPLNLLLFCFLWSPKHFKICSVNILVI